jgi:NAD(P)-dependent dehydrogenase (short-subunit alcohol dehydrogenase family)
MGKLSNRVAVVTGGGRGIGRAIALALGAAGARVVVTARTVPELDEVVGTIRSCHGQALALAADLCDREAPGRLVKQVAEADGPVEILVNNAGVGSSADPRPFVAFDDAFWDRTLMLNLTAPYLLMKAVLPAMLERRRGRIINIASINGKVPNVHAAAYVASKHGLLGLTRAVALEVAGQGVTVNAVCPGPVRTVMSDRRLEHDAARFGRTPAEQEATVTPMGRRLTPEEVAPLAVYLAGDEAAMVTGQAINVCGGVLMA